GQTYTTSGDKTAVIGCVTHILHLTITPSSTEEETASQCDSYTWSVNGQTYTTSGDKTAVIGCVTHILHLTITPSSTEEETASQCDSYTWSVNGQTYTSSGDKTAVIGCVTHILHLTITPSSTEEETASQCDSYTWSVNGQTYTSSGDKTAVIGCVTHILHLTITPSSTEEETASQCDSYTWSVNGQTYTTSGDKTAVIGCVTHILHLTITPSSSNTTTVNTCGSYTWAENGVTYTSSGTYTSITGCHTEILDLTISGSGSPATPAKIAGDYFNLCNPGNVTYTIPAVAGASSYNWVVPSGFTLVQNNGVSAIVGVPSTFTTAVLTVSAVNTCGSSAPRSLTLYAVAPNPSSVINGPTSVTAGQTNVVYKLPAVVGFTYNWTVPAGATITSGQGTNKIKVTFGTTGGFVRVNVTNACGSSPNGKLAVTIGVVAKSQGVSEKLTQATTYIKVYPNPVQSIATLVFSAQKANIRYEIVVTDVKGKAILTRSGITNTGQNMLKFNMNGYANGMYLVQLISDGETRTMKLYKEK
ncbi:MAG TPA: T9SS type A sorting domain-containing protein, partial [Panacibacter sp.]|nr:T9SS type A sorting domain-containing protein [Panacibacter sp.]